MSEQSLPPANIGASGSGDALPAPMAASIDSSQAGSPIGGLGTELASMLLHLPPPMPPPATASAANPASGPPGLSLSLAGPQAFRARPQSFRARPQAFRSRPWRLRVVTLPLSEQELKQRLKGLYPAVDEQKTPLPRSWSLKDKFSYIGLSQNNLRVHYRDDCKTPNIAASVQASHPIPVACGIYYFEVNIVSKGRDSYMGIGLSAQGVNTSILPGWDKESYCYHGDDGHVYCSSGPGQPYGPTFTTGDVIGCCVNIINNTCFYTKNGDSLGVAFIHLTPNLYPTVWLVTPGEVVDGNFGQHPFVFCIEDYIREWRTKIQAQIDQYPIEDRKGEWQAMIQKDKETEYQEAMTLELAQVQQKYFDFISNNGGWPAAEKKLKVKEPGFKEIDLFCNIRLVSSYLVHHGYCATAEAFARSTDQTVLEEFASIKNRQRIQKLVLAGRMGEAIETTQLLYPSLLEKNPSLLFTLKVRQFIEMVNGTDSEVRCLESQSLKSQESYLVSPRTFSIPSLSPSHGMSVHSLTSEVESSQSRRQLCVGSQAAIERIIHFGRKLQAMSEQLRREFGKSTVKKKMLKDAFSLLAYSDPWNSPVGNQLDPIQREPVCSALNSAILETHNLPRQPPLL